MLNDVFGFDDLSSDKERKMIQDRVDTINQFVTAKNNEQQHPLDVRVVAVRVRVR